MNFNVMKDKMFIAMISEWKNNYLKKAIRRLSTFPTVYLCEDRFPSYSI